LSKQRWRRFGGAAAAIERERAGVHEDVAVAVEHEHATLRPREGEAEADRRGEPHGADHVEAALVVAARARGARDVPVGMDAELAVEPRQHLGERVPERHHDGATNRPGRTTSATGRAVSRATPAAQSTSARAAACSGARCGISNRSRSRGRTAP
jgi:hypothetical protein